MSDQDVADVRRPGGRTVTEQNGNNKPNEAEGLAFPLSGNKKLIEEAAKAIRDVREVVVPLGDGYVSVTDADDATLARAAFAVFEKAHAHECEMCRWENGFGARKPLTHTCEKNLSTDDFPHGHPEMDPTDDAQLLAALTAYEAKAREQGSLPEPSAEHPKHLCAAEKAHTTTPPDGWFYMGSHVGAPWLNLEFSEEMDETGLPLWERPVQHTPAEVPETAPELFPGTLDALDSLTIRKEEA